MVHIKLYGTPSSTYNYVKMIMEKQAKKANVELEIEEISSTEQFMQDEIQSIPAVKVNGTFNLSYHQGADLNKFVQTLTTKLLKKEDFGIMNKFIIPTDFSETSVNAFEYARGLCGYHNGMLRAVHFYHPRSIEYEGTVLTDFDTEDIRKKQLKEFVNQMSTYWVGDSSEKVLIDKEFVVGFAGTDINDLITDPDSYFVVVGSTGSTGSFKKIFGSTSIEIAKNAKCPVIIVPPKAHFYPIRNILYACDDPQLDAEVLSRLASFAKPFEAMIHLVHVAVHPDGYPDQSLLEFWHNNYPKSKIVVANIESDDVVSALDRYTVENDIDLISMSTPHRGFFDTIFHKSITRRMAINTRIPLLIFHSRK